MQPQLTTAIYPAFEILPLRMDSTEAAVMMLAIGLQESRFEHRVQLIGRSRHWWQSLNGPARGWWQFEKAGGVVGVLRHHASREYASDICELLRYPASAGVVHRAIAHNDVLAASFARLLLWTDPEPLPTYADGADAAWEYYLRNWRPGKPHPSTWAAFWDRAWSIFQ